MSQYESPKKKMRATDKEQDEQEEVWREVFRIFDKDNNGKVSAMEVGMLLRGLELNPTQKELSDIIHKIDKNGSGQIEWEEFSVFMRHLKKTTNQEMQEMTRAFMLFDYNRDGKIDVNELRRIVTSMGEKLTLEEADLMISVADIDKDGKIDYNEFVKFICSPCYNT